MDIIVAALPVSLPFFAIALVVVAAIVLVGGVFIWRSGKKKDSAIAANGGASDWQRQSQQGQQGPWNQQGSAAGWGQQGQQQPWGAPADQNNPWANQAQQQPQAAWGNPQAQPQAAAGWEPTQAASQPQQQSWGQQPQQQPQQQPWGAPADQNNPWANQQAPAQGWGGQQDQNNPWANQQAQPQQPSNQAWGQQPAADPWGAQVAAQAPAAAQPGWQQPPQGNFGQSNPNNAMFAGADADKTVLRGAGQQPGAVGQIGQVRVEEGKEPGRIYEIRKESLSIGRSRDSDIFLEDLAVSRLHATLLNLGNGNYALKDEGSANGSKINGQVVNKYQTCQLNEGDRIQLGQTVLVFARH
ncbi:MAG TPA: FHA domain-containing protein [Ktedonobacteraceae bacterium]|nr:FHA domain-containing protein [Ktedonobacteraceae bacterium]